MNSSCHVAIDVYNSLNNINIMLGMTDEMNVKPSLYIHSYSTQKGFLLAAHVRPPAEAGRALIGSFGKYGYASLCMSF